ncbi:MAG: NADH-quinone oxidoreductase subunit NuoB, partial [Candidatus Delongbacteria bacterium]|nr:NADH-quinone oxidoreductase subunit NuoB [Candidatus Delongbacteria bacterium]
MITIGQDSKPDEKAKEMQNEFFCEALPKEVTPINNKIVQKFYNWAQANSMWVLAYGTGCGAIEMRPLYTARYDISRFGMAPRPTPRQSSLFIISGYASVKTLKRIVRSYEQMQNPKFVMGLGSCT